MRGNQENRVCLLRINQVWGDVKVGVVESLILITMREKLNSEVIHSFPSCKVPLEVLGAGLSTQGAMGKWKDEYLSWPWRCDDWPGSSFSFPTVQMGYFWTPNRTLSALPKSVTNPAPTHGVIRMAPIPLRQALETATPFVSTSPCAPGLACCTSSCLWLLLCCSLMMVLLPVVFQDPEVVFPHWNLQLLWYQPSRVSYSQSPMRQAPLLALLYG